MVSIIAHLLPGVLLALVFGYWERRHEIRGVDANTPVYSPNQAMIAILFLIISSPAIYYLGLSAGMTMDDLPSMMLLTPLVMTIMDRPVKWLMARCVKSKSAPAVNP